MPEITWIGSPNFVPGRGGHRILAIVNHIMCGTEVGTDSWFQNRSATVSAHYGVARDGRIHQYVKDEDTAEAVGLVNRPTWPLYNQIAGHANQCTLSIEHEGFPGDGLTEVQYQSTLWLHRKLISEHGVPADSLHIIGHDKLDSVNRADCPGPKFPWTRLFADLGGGTAKGGDSDVRFNELPTLQQGVAGHTNAVKAVQAIVGATTDGAFGPNTAAKVKQWQSAHNLTPDGVVGQNTWSAMLS